MSDNRANTSADRTEHSVRSDGLARTVGWVLLGVLLGAVVVALFFAYGQPGLLLEQMNLRYCG